MKLSLIAEEIGIEFEGEDKEISALNTLSDASSSELSFLDNPKYVDALTTSKAAAVLVHPKQADLVPVGTTALISEEPYLMLAYITKLFAPAPLETEGVKAVIPDSTMVAPNVYVGFGAKIGENVTIMPGAFIGDHAIIGDNTLIHPNVTIYRDCHVGKNCIIHAGTVIGSDGFGFAHTKMGEHVKIYQNGNVVLEDSIEMGSNCSVDRAVFGTTLIKEGTKIDNLVHIGHNIEIGKGVIITGQCGFAGSSKIGDYSVFGAQGGVTGHVEIAPQTTCYARTGVIASVKEPKQTLAGFPHMPHREWLKMNIKTKALIK
jgi:UDP-3-O-[3-hydroxymyristoyl] glucosamine N-acyltransferase